MDCSTPGFPVHHQLPEFTQTHVHLVSDASQPHSPILCCPLLLLPSIFPSIRVFSNESVLRIRWPKYWGFSFSISPSSEYSGLISFGMDIPVYLTKYSLKCLILVKPIFLHVYNFAAENPLKLLLLFLLRSPTVCKDVWVIYRDGLFLMSPVLLQFYDSGRWWQAPGSYAVLLGSCVEAFDLGIRPVYKLRFWGGYTFKFIPAILIPACASSRPVFLMMYSACKWNKQGDNI